MPVASLRTLLAEYAKEHGLKAEFNKVSKNKRADRFSFSLDDMDLPAVFDPSWGIQNFVSTSLRQICLTLTNMRSITEAVSLATMQTQLRNPHKWITQ